MPDLKLLIQAGNPILALETPDEPRAVRLIRNAAEALGQPLYEWSVTEGLTQVYPQRGGELAEPGKPAAALQRVKQFTTPGLFLFKDLGYHAKDAQVVRHLRDLFYAGRGRSWTLVLLESNALPTELRRLTVPVEIGWPTLDELENTVRQTFIQARRSSIYDVKVDLTKREFEQLVHTLRGLTIEEAERIVAAAIHDDYRLDATDLPRIVEAKRRRLGTLGCLESIIADVALDEIGGLERLKAWLERRRHGFSTQAREYGLEPPRGILLLGVQGCGKSLCAKVVAAAWHMPLLRLDPGVLYQKYIGETEARLREALTQAESMAPVVLWIDEIEKAFASAESNSADGGLSQRMFGTLLSWMQDHRHPIFLLATANNIAQLPPELMRKGRFDEVFFVDLPGADERRIILSIHLKRRKQDPTLFDLNALVEATSGFSGAELEQVVISGMFLAFSQKREPATADFLTEIAATQPLSVVMRERIDALRAWARGRCVPA